MYAVVQYTRLLSSSLCSSHTLTFLDRRMGPFHAASQCTHALPNRSSGSISPELVVPAVSTRQASDKFNVEQSALISFTAKKSSPNVRRTERSESRALASTEGAKRPRTPKPIAAYRAKRGPSVRSLKVSARRVTVRVLFVDCNSRFAPRSILT